MKLKYKIKLNNYYDEFNEGKRRAHSKKKKFKLKLVTISGLVIIFGYSLYQLIGWLG